MEYRRLGNSALNVSTVAMGCWGIADDNMWGKTAENEAIATIHAAVDGGINLFDTAEAYGGGRSEQIVGRALAGLRQEVVIATKVSSGHLGGAELKAACDASLERLGTDYIDLYQIHWPDFSIPAEETFAALQELVEAGKIRYAGVCNYGATALHSLPPQPEAVSNQLPYSLLWRAIETDILPQTEQRTMGVLAYSCLLHGLLSGRFASADDVPEGRARTRHFNGARGKTRHNEPGQETLTFETIDALRSVADVAGLPLHQLALSWVLHRAGVTSILAGARTPQQAAENAKIAGVRLDRDVLNLADQATARLKDALGRNADMWDSPSRMERRD